MPFSLITVWRLCLLLHCDCATYMSQPDKDVVSLIISLLHSSLSQTSTSIMSLRRNFHFKSRNSHRDNLLRFAVEELRTFQFYFYILQFYFQLFILFYIFGYFILRALQFKFFKPVFIQDDKTRNKPVVIICKQI